MLHIRRASRSDVDALVPLKAAVHALHVVHRPDVFKAMQPEDIATWLRDRLAEDDAVAWLAEDEGAPVGYALAALRAREETSFSHARAWYEIDEVAVAPSHRRGGIARALLERVAEHLHETGHDTVELTTWSFNDDAHTAFARIGFQPMISRYQLRV